MTFVHRMVSSSWQQIIFESTGKMHPLQQDIIAIIMDTMTIHLCISTLIINIALCFIGLLDFPVACLQKSIAKSLSRKYSAFSGSHPHREVSIKRDCEFFLGKCK